MGGGGGGRGGGGGEAHFSLSPVLVSTNIYYNSVGSLWVFRFSLFSFVLGGGDVVSVCACVCVHLLGGGEGMNEGRTFAISSFTDHSIGR